MKCKWLRCGICGEWARYGEICHKCGAFRLVIGGKVEYYNRDIIRMGRAIDLPMMTEQTINRVIQRAVRAYEDEVRVRNNKPSWAEYWRKNWRTVKKMMAEGKSKEQVAKELGFTDVKFRS